MDYKFTFTDGSKALIHHGIKGMKWGVWNAETAARYGGGNGTKDGYATSTDPTDPLAVVEGKDTHFGLGGYADDVGKHLQEHASMYSEDMQKAIKDGKMWVVALLSAKSTLRNLNMTSTERRIAQEAAFKRQGYSGTGGGKF